MSSRSRRRDRPSRRSTTECCRSRTPTCSVAPTTWSLISIVLVSSDFDSGAGSAAGAALDRLVVLRDQERRVRRQNRSSRHLGPRRDRLGYDRRRDGARSRKRGCSRRRRFGRRQAGVRNRRIFRGVAVLLGRHLGLEIVDDHRMLVAHELHHLRRSRHHLFGRRMRRRGVVELVLGDDDAAEHADESRGQDVDDELADEPLEHGRFVLRRQILWRQVRPSTLCTSQVRSAGSLGAA